jgi:hypothetical protein
MPREVSPGSLQAQPEGAVPEHNAPERARKNLDRHLNYVLAAYMASGS